MFATAPATTRPARSSRGREMMRTTRPPIVDGLLLALQAASSDTSTSTTARIQASSAIVTDFFHGLLGHIANCNDGACMGRVVFPILSLIMAAAVAAIFATIAHDGLGIASGTIRRDAL